MEEAIEAYMSVYRLEWHEARRRAMSVDSWIVRNHQIVGFYL